MEYKILTAFEFLLKKKQKSDHNLNLYYHLVKQTKKSALDLETALVNLPICYKLGISARYWKLIYLIHLRFLHQVPDFDSLQGNDDNQKAKSEFVVNHH